MLQVQRLRIETGFFDIQKIPSCKDSASERRNQEAIDFAIEGSDVDAVLFGLGISMVGGEIEEMLTVGKKERPAVCSVKFSVQMRDGS
jgi:hypothetical protein